MNTSKHDKSPGHGPLPSDLDNNPEIGQSKGDFATGEDIAEIAGENTVIGDVENDSGLGGSAPEGKLGRTNK